jgi:hypothetical protein
VKEKKEGMRRIRIGWINERTGERSWERGYKVKKGINERKKEIILSILLDGSCACYDIT